MKTNFLRKAKWYIVGFILVAIMLSVSLSFSAWDTLSAKASLANGGSGGYKDVYKLVEDANGNRLADVGDVVEFGNYYQDANDTVKSPLKWIVADKVLNSVTSQYELSLVSKYVLAFGSFWGVCYTKETTWTNNIFGENAEVEMCQNYSESTARAWLNFDGSSNYVRKDAGTQFSLNSNDGVAFKGFYSQAFSDVEQGSIIPKTISGMRGTNMERSGYENYATVTDKVWLPSFTEVAGSGLNWLQCSDGLPNKQFEYFKTTASAIGKTTAFASSNLSNYTIAGIQPEWTGNWDSTVAGAATPWNTRSPYATSSIAETTSRWFWAVGKSGNLGGAGGSWDARQSIRPGIILPY